MASQSETSKILSAISELKAQISSLEAKMGALALKESSEPLKPAKGKAAKKPRDPDAPKRQPTEWILFTNRVRSLLKANGYPVGSEVQQFCSHLKAERELHEWSDSEILPFREAWTAPERKPREPKSSEPKPEKPKKVLSPEHKAALLEGKKKKAAEKKASESETEKPKAKKPAEVPLPPSEPQSEAESTGSSDSKKRGPKKGTKLTDEQKAARKAKRAENKAKKEQTAIAPSEEKEEGEVSESEAEPEPEISLSPMILKGKRYLWNALNNHCYHREEDGTQGDWAGILDLSTKTIKMVPEPEDE
jgi:hypothetical protein